MRGAMLANCHRKVTGAGHSRRPELESRRSRIWGRRPQPPDSTETG